MARLIKGAFVEDLAISTGKLAQGAVTEEKITAGSVSSTKLANNAVIRARIAADAVDGSKIADSSIDSEHIVSGSVDNSHLSADSVSADKLKIAYGDSVRFVNSSGSVVGLSLDSDGDLVGPDTNKVASQSYVSTAIANLIDSAPGTLDTLNEIAASINDDANFATTVANLVNTVESSAGLNADGSYTAVSGTYLGSETSLRGGLSTLDSSLSSAVTSLTSSISSNVSSLEGKINTVEASVGLAADGSYTAFSGSNYMDSATSITGALEDLDGQAKTNADAIASNDTDIASNASSISGLSSLADSHESAIGLTSAGAYSAPSGTNYLGSTTSVMNAVEALDTAVNTVATNATRALNVSKEQELVVITSTHISNNTIAFELDNLARWHENVCVQYGNLILVPGASYDFTVSSDASAQTTTVTLNSDYNQSGGKSLVAGDVLVFRYDHDSSFTYSG